MIIVQVFVFHSFDVFEWKYKHFFVFNSSVAIREAYFICLLSLFSLILVVISILFAQEIDKCDVKWIVNECVFIFSIAIVTPPN